MDNFVQTLVQIRNKILEHMTEVKPPETTSEQEKELQSLTRCAICNRHFKEDDDKGSRPLYFHRQIQRRCACNVIWTTPPIFHEK